MQKANSHAPSRALHVFGFQETENQPCADYYVIVASREEAIRTSLAEQGHCCNISVDHGTYSPTDGELSELLRDMPVFGTPTESGAS